MSVLVFRVAFVVGGLACLLLNLSQSWAATGNSAWAPKLTCLHLLGGRMSDLNYRPAEFWLPEGAVLQAAIRFRENAPTTIKNGKAFVALLDESPAFRQAIMMVLASLDGKGISTKTSNLELYNLLNRALVNEGHIRWGTARALDAFILKAAGIEAFNSQSIQAAQKLEKALSEAWSTGSSDPIWDWLMADEALLASKSESPDGPVIVTAYDQPKSLEDVQKLISVSRSEPLLRPGEVFRDRFAIDLLNMQRLVYALQEEVKILNRMAGLGALKAYSHGAANAVAALSNQEQREAGAISIFTELLASAQFHETAQAFSIHYFDAYKEIARIFGSPTLRDEERAKLREVVIDRLIPLSMEIAAYGIRPNCISPRYREIGRSLAGVNHFYWHNLVPEAPLIGPN